MVGPMLMKGFQASQTTFVHALSVALIVVVVWAHINICKHQQINTDRNKHSGPMQFGLLNTYVHATYARATYATYAHAFSVAAGSQPIAITGVNQ